MTERPGPAVVAGAGALRSCLEVLAMAARRIMVVRGGRSYDQSGAGALLRRAWPQDATVVHASDVTPNPCLDDVRRAVASARCFGPELVLGVGGGSALDVAKAVAVLMPQPGPPDAYLDRSTAIARPRSASLILVPTTAGSGSEVTRFATIYHGGRKASLDHPAVYADLAIVDPLLTHSMSAPVTASSGLDALGHAVESFWSRRATDASRRLAVDALAIGSGCLEQVLTAPTPASRAGMSQAALLAGLAIDVTRTTAAHAFSYPLTARFGVPHGVAVALNLCWLFGYNAGVTARDCTHPEGPQVVRGLVRRAVRTLGAESEAQAPSLLRRWLRLGGYPERLREWGVGAGDIAWVTDEALVSPRSDNNPRRLDPDRAATALRALR
jgi:alcohol dehydrogenase class IV